MQLYPKLITDALSTVIYAGTKKNLIESEMLADQPKIDGMKVEVTLVFPKETDPFMASTIKAAEAAIHYHVSKDVEVTIKTENTVSQLRWVRAERIERTDAATLKKEQDEFQKAFGEELERI